jgi:His/Glu/Gln/Arg/opine family amino acid ABC transporter permease subunit
MNVSYLPYVVSGVGLTLAVALGALVLATVLGIVAAAARLSTGRIARVAAGTYATLIRGVPDLVLMLLIFYGGQIALNALAEAAGLIDEGGSLDIDPFTAGTITIGFIYGAYFAETFRGAMLAVPVGQSEAALACGMSRRQVLLRIVLPQAVRHALPGFTNNWLVLVKSTALVSIIGLTDLMYRAKQAGAAARAAFFYFVVAAVVYLAITTVSLAALRALERRHARGVRRAGA